jgi:hypothetical protein
MDMAITGIFDVSASGSDCRQRSVALRMVRFLGRLPCLFVYLVHYGIQCCRLPFGHPLTPLHLHHHHLLRNLAPYCKVHPRPGTTLPVHTVHPLHGAFYTPNPSLFYILLPRTTHFRGVILRWFSTSLRATTSARTPIQTPVSG